MATQSSSRMSNAAVTLRASLDYDPVPLKFGTSGRRGLVADLTQLEVYITATAELEYLQSLPKPEGGIVRGEEFYFACDLRPSSSQIVSEPKTSPDLAAAIRDRCSRVNSQPPRGGLTQAVAQAIADSGMRPVFLGRIPTPALASYAFDRAKGSMMVTGSHIPFDRNGYKTNTAHGELLKRDETPIQARVEKVRARLYNQPATESRFNAGGMFQADSGELPPATREATEAFLRRYADFFAGQTLRGKRILVYQHSAVGRDFLVELLRHFGAEVIPAGRSETFVPIDTEAIDAEQLGIIQSLATAAWQQHGPLDAVVSIDGDSDRPLVLGVEPEGTSCRVKFFGGDLVGMVVAEYLKADAVVVPVSCNDALDRGPLRAVVEPKTRIGSPYVIAGMQQAVAAGRKAVCGWEANGGFLLGSTLTRNGRTLRALPTRDAFLPILGVLFCAAEKGKSVCALFDELPRRFSRAALLKNFPRPISEKIVRRFSPAESDVHEIIFARATDPGQLKIRADLGTFFSPALGFGAVEKVDYTDGVRIYFSNGDVAHVRPSGNADELRIYAVADTQSRANAIARMGVAEPDGILRRLEAAVSS